MPIASLTSPSLISTYRAWRGGAWTRLLTETDSISSTSTYRPFQSHLLILQSNALWIGKGNSFYLFLTNFHFIFFLIKPQYPCTAASIGTLALHETLTSTRLCHVT